MTLCLPYDIGLNVRYGRQASYVLAFISKRGFVWNTTACAVSVLCTPHAHLHAWTPWHERLHRTKRGLANIAIAYKILKIRSVLR